jgi:hypothetical protein
MQVNETCKFLCEAKDIPAKDAQFINERIKEGYAHNWAVDGLPAANEVVDLHTNEKYYKIGFNMGLVYNDVTYLNNHYDIKIHYHVTTRGLSRVVGVAVEPSSRDTQSDKQCSEKLSRFHLEEDGKSSVIYTYSVTWIVSHILIVYTYVLTLCVVFGYCLGYKMGWLSSHLGSFYSLVFAHQLCHYCIVSNWHGFHDLIACSS